MSTKSFRKTKGEFLLISPWKHRVNVTNSLRNLKGKLSPYYPRESNGKCYKLPQKNKRVKYLHITAVSQMVNVTNSLRKTKGVKYLHIISGETKRRREAHLSPAHLGRVGQLETLHYTEFHLQQNLQRELPFTPFSSVFWNNSKSNTKMYEQIGQRTRSQEQSPVGKSKLVRLGVIL